MTTFAQRYGPWALVAGASEGIGGAFARALAGRGLDLVLVARRPEPLAALAAALPVRTVTVTADLATPAGLAAVVAATTAYEIGLVVVNAAYAPSGPFADADHAGLQRVLDLNCGALVHLAHHYLPPMADRHRGGLIVMSSASGMQGNPLLSTYAASKAFGAVLAEGLWWELRDRGVDVTTCVAGAVSTPGLTRASRRGAPGTVTPDAVVAAALARLGHGPRVVPGTFMRVSTTVLTRLVPRTSAIELMARATRRVLRGAPDRRVAQRESPAAMSAPRDRQDMIEATETADRIEPAATKEPIARTEPKEPIEPMDRIEPVEPTDRIESFE